MYSLSGSAVARVTYALRRYPVPPSVAFALTFVVLGWISGHCITYALVDFATQDHHHEPHDFQGHMDGYLGVLRLVGVGGLLLSFGLALNSFLRNGSFGEWLHEGGVSGSRRQVALATIPPASVLVIVVHLEHLVGYAGSFVVGMAFGAGWTPCIGPVLAGILTLAATTNSMSQGMGLLAAYSARLTIPFLLATVALDRFLSASRRFRAAAPWIERFSGVLLILLAFLLLTGSMSVLAGWLSQFAVPEWTL